MKPHEEMHAAVEEVDIDPCDLFVDLGTLIVEGRVPGLAERGFGESPHCPAPHGQNRHQCNPTSTECQKYEQIQKHMLMLWRNGIPMSIEVLLYPSCCTPSQNVDSLPEMAYILLEQWTIHMLPRRVPDANINSRGLIQAVRSFLYFSQLCAWLSLTGGKSPRNVHYRVCVPGEAFSSKFCAQPDCHIFPIANIGRNAAMKVLMKCHPRCGEIPVVPCLKHSLPSPPLKTSKTKACKETEELKSDFVYDGIVLPNTSSRTSSPADTMLGESLLDPPNSLCMYPKRYQSPSRCGSPSIEVPEHLMFGKASTSARREEETPRRRSRPQRRPVVERFLKKTLGDDVPAMSSTHQALQYPLKEVHKSSADCGKEAALSYMCIDDDIKTLPREEMEEVLQRLRERQSGVKHPHGDVVPDIFGESTSGQKSLPSYMNEMRISTHELTPEKDLSQSLFKEHQVESKNLFKRTLKMNKEISYSRKFGDVFEQISDSKQSLDLIPNPASNDSLSRESDLKRSKNCKIRSPAYNMHNSQTSKYKELRENFYNRTLREKPTSVSKRLFSKSDNRYYDAYHGDVESDIDCQEHTKLSGVNIKKYGAILPNRTSVDELTDEREIVRSSETNTAICELSASTDNVNEESATFPYSIPSAEEKAFFRRSLDSATSLVFHQRSGLPLTSSPAPIRKSGTCFDFDSSLTTVSAIKRALFEKEESGEVAEPRPANLSNSAPASVIISSSLLGTFEESVLNGRLEPVSTVEGFTAEIGASGSFCPRHITLPVTVFFYTLQDMDKVTSPYMGHINLRNKDYYVPKRGTVQVTLFNPHKTVVKMFVVRYDLSDMPVNCQTFLRQRTLYMPADAHEDGQEAQKWLRYLIHLRFASTKSGRIYLHTDIRVIIFRKSDLDAATVHGQRPYELRSFTHSPVNPKFSPLKL